MSGVASQTGLAEALSSIDRLVEGLEGAESDAALEPGTPLGGLVDRVVDEWTFRSSMEALTGLGRWVSGVSEDIGQVDEFDPRMTEAIIRVTRALALPAFAVLEQEGFTSADGASLETLWSRVYQWPAIGPLCCASVKAAELENTWPTPELPHRPSPRF